MFRRKKKTSTVMTYDPAIRVPVIRCSICTGEQVAGFKNLSDGRFEEVMLIRTSADLKAFREQRFFRLTGEKSIRVNMKRRRVIR